MVNASISLETKWILTTACQLEGAPWDHNFWSRIADFPGTRDAWLEEDARAVWASVAPDENAFLSAISLETYAFAEGFRAMQLEELWPESFVAEWKMFLKTLQRSKCKRLLRVLQNLQAQVAPSEWPEGARARFKRLKRTTLAICLSFKGISDVKLR